MKIIELLVRIANNEEIPKKIKYQGELWEYNEFYDDYEKDNTYLFGYLFAHENTNDFINDEVEIIDKKMCKINLYYSVPNKIHDMKVLRETLEQIIENQRTQEDKINELIDKVNKFEEVIK